MAGKRTSSKAMKNITGDNIFSIVLILFSIIFGIFILYAALHAPLG